MTPIEAINNAAKAYQDLAIVLLAVADKTVAVPAGKATAKEVKSPGKNITIEQVRAVMAEKSQAGLTSKVKELLEKYGANKLSAINPDDYAALMDEAAQLK